MEGPLSGEHRVQGVTRRFDVIITPSFKFISNEILHVRYDLSRFSAIRRGHFDDCEVFSVHLKQ